MSMGFFESVPGLLNTLLDRLSATRAANLDHLDSDVSDCLQAADPKVNHLDADISSRATPADVNAYSPIKSIQTGNFTFNAGDSGTVTLSTAVDTTKAVVFANCKSGYYQGATAAGLTYAFTCGINLTSSTQLSWESGGNDTTDTGTCYWTVVEYN